MIWKNQDQKTLHILLLQAIQSLKEADILTYGMGVRWKKVKGDREFKCNFKIYGGPIVSYNLEIHDFSGPNVIFFEGN